MGHEMTVPRSPLDDTDDRLLRRAKEGDRDAFGRLAERVRGMMFAFAAGRTRDRELAEDAVQESLLRAWKSIDKIPDAAAFYGWMYATGRNCVLEMERQRRKFRRVPESLDPEMRTSPGTREQELLTEISDLPEEMRIVLTLKYADGVSCAEISRRLGRPIGTVTSLLSRAYHELRNRWKGRGHELS